jgi:hypothetical protein
LARGWLVIDSFNEDPKDYYAILGVASSATLDEVKSAFRLRAKEVHPDTNPDENAKSQFQKLNEAYECLSEPGPRSRYDVSGYPDPVVCSRCCDIISQPRRRVFQIVVSAIRSTATTPVEGIFCAACARKTALKASLISAARGWWGVPSGPAVTVSSVLQNARGGYEPPGSKEVLLWQNLQAFLAMGKYRLAYDIARELKEANDKKIATKAVKLMDVLQVGGASIEPPSGGWDRNLFDYALHAALLFAVPTVLIIAVYASLGPAWQAMKGPETPQPLVQIILR